METPLDLTEKRATEMSVGDWLITFLITAIPIVGVVMLFVWAFGSNDNTTRGTWAKANLIMILIMIALYTIFMLVFGAAFLAGMSGME